MSGASLTLVSQGSTQPADLGDISANGLFVSYIDEATALGQNDVLYVRNLTDGSLTTVVSFPANLASTFSFTGVDGGALSSDGRYVFYSTGVVHGDYGGGSTTQLFVKDLQFPLDPPVEVTPSFDPKIGPSPFGVVAHAFQGLLPVEISDDGCHVLYGRNYADFTTTPTTERDTVITHYDLIGEASSVREADDSSLLSSTQLTMVPLDFSSDGRFVLFETRIPLLGEGNQNHH